MEHEPDDEAHDTWERAHNKNQQGMDEWVSYLKKRKLELITQGLEMVISPMMMVCRNGAQ